MQPADAANMCDKTVLHRISATLLRHIDESMNGINLFKYKHTVTQKTISYKPRYQTLLKFT